MANSLNVSQISVQVKVEEDDEGPELSPNPAGHPQVNQNSVETLDDNTDDMQQLMKLTNSNNNDEIKIKMKDYKLEGFDHDNISIEEAGTKIYESDDEEKNFTKTTFKNNSREEQLKLIPSLGQSVLEMTKFRESRMNMNILPSIQIILS